MSENEAADDGKKAAPSGEVVSVNYDGRFVVFNCMPDDVSELTCLHQCEQKELTTRIEVPILAAQTASNVQILHSATWDLDIWLLMFRVAQQWYVRGTKFCNFEWDDANGLCIVTLIKGPDNGHFFSIIPPVSSPCLGNRYMAVLEDELPPPREKDKVPGRGPEEEYTGSFVVVNATNSIINNVAIEHEYNAKKAGIKIPVMQKDDVSVAHPINSATWHNDYWSVSFNLGSERKYRNSKQCNYVKSDFPSTCLIILYNDNFSVLTPGSDPCLHNYY